MIRLGRRTTWLALADIYRRASLSNPGDRDRLLAHPEYLVLEPDGLAEGRTHVAEEDGSVVGFATWAETYDGGMELEDLFVDPKWMRRGIATALVNCLSRCAPVAGRGHPGGHRQPGRAGFLPRGRVHRRRRHPDRVRQRTPAAAQIALTDARRLKPGRQS